MQEDVEITDMEIEDETGGEDKQRNLLFKRKQDDFEVIIWNYYHYLVKAALVLRKMHHQRRTLTNSLTIYG